MTDDGRHHIDSTKYGLHTIMRLRVSSKQKADLINVISNNIIKLTTYKIHAHKIYNLNLLAWKLAQLLGTISPNWNIQLVEAPRYRIGTAPTKIGESGEIKNLYRNWNIHPAKIPQYWGVLPQRTLLSSINQWNNWSELKYLPGKNSPVPTGTVTTEVVEFRE